MNKDIIEGKWNEVKGKIKETWAKFTDDDVTAMKGNYDELHGHLQKKYGYDKDKANEEINNFVKKNKLDDENK